MAIQFFINIFFGFLWMFLSSEFNHEYFAVGFFWGLIILVIFRKVLPGKHLYFIVLWRWLKIIWLFLIELIKADIAVFQLMFKAKLDVNPVIFEYPLSVKKDWQIVMLANMITLTPGTISANISHDNSKIFIHRLDTDDIPGEIDAIKTSFEKWLLEVDK
ncbi:MULTISPECIES: Na+/H+ antiporter subunit E [unclassified Gemella]|uniref:Na+/H+ antiporter subunit E n=1 Tax=unclassified Gemella TaxID=2624949 RepID=UPI001074792E|nr:MULTISPECIES: Na+/H+ antiporter subunit E [unclassified Gemella]MBF0710708.1 Na+/H+ antiporter subunit E [Gemella sp. GL1.1]MBF0746723.1 Na+/H+ antiporter subunit E [Gemella sp. 19428wG2_WT2a]NYS28052.1 Na+/H+ antiporter subunit E [Gemella sp. GL1]TFU60071.1 Na+/H+ antiporter subunit E [Gemella sp. WT2a]